jgi:glutamate synthase domain-containing protein 2
MTGGVSAYAFGIAIAGDDGGTGETLAGAGSST